ncbi:uncharacterized protein N7496_008665 [Penicillium cataractarum]|uniref:Uncharacterized protein n=1 Tax=Penicillium cataractarum TaxID=2100454 RepID=A0A9W9V754_9EURO|nr:uncharacterized protein N7496_008665 [Penicillium cataractarum]KAJ5368905.1 hypothetical protein N7496_008665 [Penicillium cataractarum]
MTDELADLLDERYRDAKTAWPGNTSELSYAAYTAKYGDPELGAGWAAGWPIEDMVPMQGLIDSGYYDVVPSEPRNSSEWMGAHEIADIESGAYDHPGEWPPFPYEDDGLDDYYAGYEWEYMFSKQEDTEESDADANPSESEYHDDSDDEPFSPCARKRGEASWYPRQIASGPSDDIRRIDQMPVPQETAGLETTEDSSW